MMTWMLPCGLVLAARGDDGGPLGVLLGLMVLANVGLGVLAWIQAQRIERNTDHIRKLLGQVKPLRSALPLLAGWARITRDRRQAYRERKKQAIDAGADAPALLRIAENAIDDMDMGDFAKNVDTLFAEVGFRPPPLPVKADDAAEDDETLLSLD